MGMKNTCQMYHWPSKSHSLVVGGLLKCFEVSCLVWTPYGVKKKNSVNSFDPSDWTENKNGVTKTAMEPHCVARSDAYLPSTQTSPNRPNPVQQNPNQSLYLKDKYSAAFSYKWCKQIPQATRGPRKNEWLATTMSFRTPRCAETAWDKNITNHIYFFL